MISIPNSVILIMAFNEGTPSIDLYQDHILAILHNSEKYPIKEIEQCKSNIYRTLYMIRKETDIPIIVIDDGSKDDTVDEVERYQLSCPNHNIQIIQHKKNQGKGAGFLTGTKLLPQTIKHIITTDADLIVPNAMMRTINQLVKECNESKPMRLYNFLCMQSWHKNWPHEDFLVDALTGTRVIHYESRQKAVIKHGYSNIRDVITRHKYSLEVALNNILSTSMADMNNNLADIDPKQLSEIALFLPGCRHYESYDIINKQIRATGKHYFSNMYDRSLKYRFFKRRDSLIRK